VGHECLDDEVNVFMLLSSSMLPVFMLPVLLYCLQYRRRRASL
jgi:hypothetical protein